MHLALNVLTVWLISSAASAQRGIPDNMLSITESLRAGKEARLCTHRLSNMLTIICNATYNGALSKRGMGDYSDENGVESSWPFIPRTAAEAMLMGGGGAYRRYRRQAGIVDECCRKSCTLNEIISYCG